MKKNDAFPSKYLKAQDVLDNDGELDLTIRDAVEEILKDKQGKDESKVIVYFNEEEKGLVLNLTNWNAIETITGKDDSDDWVGEKITLETQMISAFGETKPAIRVKLARPKKSAKSPDKTSAFWEAVYGMNLGPDDGKKILAENDNDFAKALAALSAQEFPVD